MKRVPPLRRRDFFRDVRAGVVVSRQTRQLPMAQHRHEFFEVVLILSGTGIHATGRFQHRLEAGDVLVIDPRRTHGYADPRGLNLVNILVREDVWARIGRDLRTLPGYHALFTLAAVHWRDSPYAARLRLNAGDLRQASEWADRLEEESGKGTRDGHLLAEAYLTLLAGLLVRRHGRQAPPGSRPGTPGAGPAMGSLLSWMEQHLEEPLPVARLAARARMSARTFHRKFLQACGVTPGEYILQRRMARAAELLRLEPASSVGEVAARCGFDDPNHFSRTFRARMRRSPREWRRGAGTE